MFDLTMIVYLAILIGLFTFKMGWTALVGAHNIGPSSPAAPSMLAGFGRARRVVVADRDEDATLNESATTYIGERSEPLSIETIIADMQNDSVSFLLDDDPETPPAQQAERFSHQRHAGDILTLPADEFSPVDDEDEGETFDDGVSGASVIELQLAERENDDAVLVGEDDGHDTVSAEPASEPADMGEAPEVMGDHEEDENIFLDIADTDFGGEEDETYTVYEATDADRHAVHVADFDALRDTLTIQYHAQVDPVTGERFDPGLTVAYIAAANLTSVQIYGAEIATLDGDAGITADDITLSEIS